MDGGIGVASGLAGLITISAQITKLIYGYVKDVKHASRNQKAYLSEISSLTDILLRFENVLQDADEHIKVDAPRPSIDTIQQCYEKLSRQYTKLQKHSNRFIWPFEATEVRKAVEDLHRYRDVFAGYVAASTSSLAAATLSGVESLRLEQNKASFLDALRRGELVFKAKPETLAGTGTWLLQHPDYEAWLSSTPSVLWCRGAPGVGKSSLASVVIENLGERKSQEDGYVLYHFCNFASRKQETEMVILQDLLCQIAEQGDDDAISFLHQNRHSTTSPSSTPNDVAQVLTHVPLRGPVYLVIDGLDEVENTKKILSRLLSLVKIDFRVLVTSRDHPDIRTAFDQVPSLDIHANPGDIKAYVRDRFQESDFADVVDESHNLIDSIIDRSSGLFILAKLLMDQMFTCTNIKQMRKVLSSSPTTIADAYQSSLERIRALKTPSRDLALRLISWIVHAERALRPREIIHAFAVEPDEDEIDEESLTRLPNLLRNCAGLVVLDLELDSLGLVHTTAYEYFSANDTDTERVHFDIAFTSLHYLKLKPFRSERCSNVEQMDQRLEKLPFLRYAARHWGRHVLKSKAEDGLNALICLVLKNDLVRSNAFLALFYRSVLQDQEFAKAIFLSIPDGHSELHATAYWGLVQTTKQFISDGIDPNGGNSQKWCPLHWAAHNGHHTVCQVLLDNGANPDAQDDRGWTPLFWSSFYRNVQDMKLLLERGADYTIKDSNGWTALHWAVSKGEAESVKLLLLHHAQQNPTQALSRAENSAGESIDLLASEKLLEIAANENDLDMFEILLNAHLDTQNPDFGALWTTGRFDPPLGNPWRTLNKAESMGGFEAYIDRANNFNRDRPIPEDHWKGRLVHSAIKDDQLSGLKLLLQLGADPNHKMKRSPLHAAALRCNPEYTRLLLEFGADATLLDHYGQTALHQAIECGFADTVQALIEGGADVNSCVKEGARGVFATNKGKTPLMLACELPSTSEMAVQSRSKIIEYLTAANADVKSVNLRNHSVLHYAIQSGDVNIVRKIIRLGADVNRTNDQGVSATHLAARSCDVHLVELLTNSGATTLGEDTHGRNCLHFFAEGSDQAHTVEDLNKLFDFIKSDLTHMNALAQEHTPLSRAITNKNWKIFQIIADAGALLPPYADSLLQSPVESLRPHVVRFVLDHRAQSSDKSSDSPEPTKLKVIPWLWTALRDDPVNSESLDDVIGQLQPVIDKNLNETYCSENLLHRAGERSNSDELSAVLLKYGCDPFAKNRAGIDVFLSAVLKQKTLMLRELLLNCPLSPPENHWVHHVEGLSDPQTDVLACVCKAFQASGQLNEPLPNGRLLLREAIDSNSVHFALGLIDMGADPAIRDKYGWNLLHHAVHRSRPEIVDKILSQHESLAHTVTTKWGTDWYRPSGLYIGNDWTGTPLHLAVLTRQKDVVLKLLKLGVDVNARTGRAVAMPSHGPWALYIALHRNGVYSIPEGGLSEDSLCIARMLLEHGAHLNKAGEYLIRPGDRRKFDFFEDVWERLKGKGDAGVDAGGKGS